MRRLTNEDKTEKIRKILFQLTIISLLIAYLVFINRAGKFSLFWKNREIVEMRAESGFAWLGSVKDSSIAKTNAKIELREGNNVFLRDKTSSTELTRQFGSGRFVIWENGEILFSASDNSNPMENGREYRAIYPYVIGNRFARFVYALFCLFFCAWVACYIPAIILRFLSAVKNVLRSPAKIAKILICVGLAAPLFAQLIRLLINQALWGDEIRALYTYCFDENVLFPLTVYDLPNNHIPLDFLIAVYVKLFQIENWCAIARQPWTLRVIFLLFTAATALFTALSAERLHKRASFPALLLLCTAIPFYNWTTQIRGYSLIYALISILIYAQISYQRQPNARWKALSVAAATLIVYIIPFYLLFIGGFMLFHAMQSCVECLPLWKSARNWRERLKILLDNPSFQMLSSFLFGLLVIILLYYPVWDQLLSVYRPGGFAEPIGDRNIIRHFTDQIIGKNLISLTSAFIAGKAGILLPMIGGAAVYICQRFRKRKTINDWFTALFFIVVFTPFLVCGITAYSPFNRHFTPLLPIMAIAGALLISLFLERFPWRAIQTILFSAMAIYCIIGFISMTEKTRHAAPTNVPWSLDDLIEPYFVSAQLDSNGFLEQVKEMNKSEQIPIIVAWPADFYIYDLCACHEERCLCDYVGAEAQEIIASKKPFFMIQTLMRGQEEKSPEPAYQAQCVPVTTDKRYAYRLYRCN